MPFIGKNPTSGFSTIVKDDLTPDGSTTAFTLSKNVASANDIAVFVGNVRQEPTDAYSVSGTTLTMTAAPASGLNFYVLHIAGTLESSVIPADNTISTAKLQSSAVTDAKIAGMASSKLTGALPAISGAALTGISTDPYPATIDHFVVTHSGAINANTLTYPSGTLVSSNNVTIANSNEITPSVAGRYIITTNVSATGSFGSGYTPTTYIYKNTSNEAARSAIRYYAGSSTMDFPTLTYILDMNGTTDYMKVAFYQNSANATINAGYTVGFRIDQ